MSSLIGKTLGPYKLETALGKGGMATVFRAFQASVRRPVAIKVMAPEIASQPGFMERFVQEAQVIASLEHPRILPVFDYGEADGLHYIVMRLVDGGSLDDRIMARPLAFGEVAHYLTQIASALDYAHKRGVIHRDLKPNNVLLDSENNVYLTDFGIARLAGGDRKLTATGSVIGTPAYISPEQGMGRPVDARSDVYSLGILLYEMLTQQLPFQADTPAALIFLHVYEQPRRASDYRADLPSSVIDVLDKALAKQPEARYPTAGELATAYAGAIGLYNPTQAPLTPTATSLPPSTGPAQTPESTDERTMALERSADAVASPLPTTATHEPTLVENQALLPAFDAPPAPSISPLPVTTPDNVRTVIEDRVIAPSNQAALPTVGTPAPKVKSVAAKAVVRPQRRRLRLVMLALAAFLVILIGVGIYTVVRPALIQQANLAWTPDIKTFTYKGYKVEMVYVPSGSFTMGDDAIPGVNTGNPASPQTIDQPFWLDRDEVTEAQFNALDGEALTFNSNVSGGTPRSFISWREATKFCHDKRDGFLPTEAQWEWAARGPRSLRYPWGNGWDPTKVVMKTSAQSMPPLAGSMPQGASWVGALDMSGSLKEWTSSKMNFYPYNAKDGRENQIVSFENRVIRGGSWLSPDATSFLAAYRYDWSPDQRNGEVGFRCAHSA